MHKTETYMPTQQLQPSPNCYSPLIFRLMRPIMTKFRRLRAWL